MSSSNLVRLAYIKESVLGETPAAGDFDTFRFISESLSGTPDTTESQQIRTDRMSSGQVVTGLQVAGDKSFELAKETQLEDFMESAMHSDFAAGASMSETFTIDNVAKTIIRGAGDYLADGVKIGDIVVGTGFTDPLNAEPVMVRLVDASTITYVGELVDVSEVALLDVSSNVGIGIDKKSFSVEKSFLDLTEKAIVYKGMLANTMQLSVAYGDIINGSFGLVGTKYETVSGAANFITDGRTILPPATTQSLNGSIDMPFLASSAVGVLDEVSFCIQSVELNLNNNLLAQNCIGEAAAVDYSSGTAQIEVSISAYLSDENWAILGKKLTQESFALGFMVKNLDGWYYFYLPAVQVSFDDPASGGANQDVILDMSGTAKVGSLGESALRIYKS